MSKIALCFSYENDQMKPVISHLENLAFKVYTISSLQEENICDLLAQIEQEEGYLDLLVLNASSGCDASESLSAEGTEELLALLDKQIFDVQSLIEASLPLLRKGEMKRIGMITTPASSIRLCRDTKNFGEHMALAGINMVGKIYFNRLRPEGFTFRWFCDNPEHKGGLKAGEYLLMNFCFDPKEPYIHSDENRLVMRDAYLQEISW